MSIKSQPKYLFYAMNKYSCYLCMHHQNDAWTTLKKHFTTEHPNESRAGLQNRCKKGNKNKSKTQSTTKTEQMKNRITAAITNLKNRIGSTKNEITINITKNYQGTKSTSKSKTITKALKKGVSSGWLTLDQSRYRLTLHRNNKKNKKNQTTAFDSFWKTKITNAMSYLTTTQHPDNFRSFISKTIIESLSEIEELTKKDKIEINSTLNQGVQQGWLLRYGKEYQLNVRVCQFCQGTNHTESKCPTLDIHPKYQYCNTCHFCQGSHANADCPTLDTSSTYHVCPHFIAGVCPYGYACRNGSHPSPDEVLEYQYEFSLHKCAFGSNCQTTACLYKHPGERAGSRVVSACPPSRVWQQSDGVISQSLNAVGALPFHFVAPSNAPRMEMNKPSNQSSDQHFQNYQTLVHKSKRKEEDVLAKRMKPPFAAWEDGKNNVGFATKILIKHGFTGRLGKDAQGIAEPILPMHRSPLDKEGLGM